MKLKTAGLAGLAAMALAAFAASPASATTLEVNGVTQNSSVSLSASTAPDTGVAWVRPDLTVANTCWESSVAGSTSSPFTGENVTGAISSLTFGSCTRTVTVDKAGQLYVKHISGTTNGTVFSENTEVTVKTPFFEPEVNCKTGGGTDIGTLTGVSSGNATLDINAVLNCGFLLPKALWGGTYVITSPAGFGVSA